MTTTTTTTTNSCAILLSLFFSFSLCGYSQNAVTGNSNPIENRRIEAVNTLAEAKYYEIISTNKDLVLPKIDSVLLDQIKKIRDPKEIRYIILSIDSKIKVYPYSLQNSTSHVNKQK